MDAISLASGSPAPHYFNCFEVRGVIFKFAYIRENSRLKVLPLFALLEIQSGYKSHRLSINNRCPGQ